MALKNSEFSLKSLFLINFSPFLKLEEYTKPIKIEQICLICSTILFGLDTYEKISTLSVYSETFKAESNKFK
ncbi:hypothetical protein WICPIJ_004028 [Wickerhamomyces pijperi]|uniref:Uncharacterized protein n=1 Tax=Wickerhamomyces pijperi TaxID=599730 RepID=A0A9P8TNP0_WICPI|nr:hypothetical protein WICPIJ_004028 [Wickerhamomyces pijperi]